MHYVLLENILSSSQFLRDSLVWNGWWLNGTHNASIERTPHPSCKRGLTFPNWNLSGKPDCFPCCAKQAHPKQLQTEVVKCMFIAGQWRQHLESHINTTPWAHEYTHHTQSHTGKDGQLYPQQSPYWNRKAGTCTHVNLPSAQHSLQALMESLQENCSILNKLNTSVLTLQYDLNICWEVF